MYETYIFTFNSVCSWYESVRWNFKNKPISKLPEHVNTVYFLISDL